MIGIGGASNKSGTTGLQVTQNTMFAQPSHFATDSQSLSISSISLGTKRENRNVSTCTSPANKSSGMELDIGLFGLFQQPSL